MRDFANQVMTSGKVDNFEGVVVLGELLEFVLVTLEKLMGRTEEVASMLPQAQRSDFAIGGPILTRLEEIWNLVKGQEDQEREAKESRDAIALMAQLEADIQRARGECRHAGRARKGWKAGCQRWPTCSAGG